MSPSTVHSWDPSLSKARPPDARVSLGEKHVEIVRPNGRSWTGHRRRRLVSAGQGIRYISPMRTSEFTRAERVTLLMLFVALVSLVTPLSLTVLTNRLFWPRAVRACDPTLPPVAGDRRLSAGRSPSGDVSPEQAGRARWVVFR